MSKVVKRLLTFFIGIPLVLAVVFCDFLNHLPLQIAIGVFAVLGANEFYNMLTKKGCILFNKELLLIDSFSIGISNFVLTIEELIISSGF